MILYLVRHPKPLVEAGICYGQLDVAAENPGAVARRLAGELPADLPVYSSPLRRCRELAEWLHPAPVIDPRLREMDFGAWEGRAWDAIPRAELDAWAADVGGYAPPGGESPRQVQQRALDFVAGLDVPAAVVVTHAGVIRVLLADQLALPPRAWTTLNFPYASCTRLVLAR